MKEWQKFSSCKLIHGQYFCDNFILLYTVIRFTASLLFVPSGLGANSLQNCYFCSFCSHKQRCWTVLSELWYEVGSNLNTFSWVGSNEQLLKSLKLHCKYIKMYIAGVWAKTAKGCFKMSRNKSFYFKAKFGAIYSVSKAKKYLLKNSTIGNRLLF